MGCGNCADRVRDIDFFSLPAIVTVKDKEFRKLTVQQRGAWITAINRKDMKQNSLKYTCICSNHFISIKSSACASKITDNIETGDNVVHGSTSLQT